MSKLVHINKVEYARVAEVLSLRLINKHSCVLKNVVNFKEIPIEGLVSVKIEDVVQNNEIIYTSTATFRTCDKSPWNDRKLVFRLTSVNGNVFILGNRSRPYPIIKEINPYPEKPNDDTLKTVQVTWKATTPMLYLVD